MSYLDWDVTTNREQRRRRYNLLDGVDSQAGSSKPTVRSDGTPLQTGDRWLSTSDRMWFYWSGSYWLSEEVYRHIYNTTSTGATQQFPGGVDIDSNFNYWVRETRLSGRFQATQDASNYWTFRLLRDTTTTTDIAISTQALTSVGAGAKNLAYSVNTHLDTTALGLVTFRNDLLRTGSPGAINAPVLAIYYQLAKP